MQQLGAVMDALKYWLFQQLTLVIDNITFVDVTLPLYELLRYIFMLDVK